jgi:hypothetical protein
MGDWFKVFQGIVVLSTLKHFDCFNFEEKCNTILRNIGSHSSNDTSQPRLSKSQYQGKFGYDVHKILVNKCRTAHRLRKVLKHEG